MPEKNSLISPAKPSVAESRPLVSVGIPTYNRADGLLRNALSSALAQTYDNLEIIISDNCSDDHTGDLIATFEDDRIRYHRHPENIGANNNFNYCVNQAIGEWFVLLHDDDLIDPDFIESCLSALGESRQAGIVRTGTRIVDADGRQQIAYENQAANMPPLQQVYEWFAGKTGFYLCSTLFNTRLLQAIGGFNSPHNLFQDVVAEIQLLARYGSVDVADVKASFRVHSGEMTHAVAVGKWCEDSTYLLQVICEEFPQDAKALERAGKPFLCRLNYKRASTVSSLPKRLLVFWQVYSHFDRAFPLWRYLRSRYGTRLRSSLGFTS